MRSKAFQVALVLFELICAFVPLIIFSMAAAFHGEGTRGRGSNLEGIWMPLGLGIALTPILLAFWLGWRVFFVTPSPRLVVWLLPVLCSAVAVPLAAWMITLAEKTSTAAVERIRLGRISIIRAELLHGDTSGACELIALDPLAKPEEMNICRARIDGILDNKMKWLELQKFVEWNRHFKTWNLYQLGEAKEWNWQHDGTVPVVPKKDQSWFVETYFGTWLAQPDALTTNQDLGNLQIKLDSISDDNWSPEVLTSFSKNITPLLRSRIATTAKMLTDEDSKYTLAAISEKLDKLQKP